MKEAGAFSEWLQGEAEGAGAAAPGLIMKRGVGPGHSQSKLRLLARIELKGPPSSCTFAE